MIGATLWDASERLGRFRVNRAGGQNKLMKKEGESRVICGAKTKSGGVCKRSPTIGKRRCKFHGGAPGHGAPKGNTNALKHGIYSDALLPEEAEIWDSVHDHLGKLDHEITMSRIKLIRLHKLQKEADEATLSGGNEAKALQLEEVSTSDTNSSNDGGPSASKTSTIVKKRRDYHSEIRLMTKTIGDLEEKRAKLLSGDNTTDGDPPNRITVEVIDARKRRGTSDDDEADGD